MVVTLVVTANCSEKWTMDTWSKQTQSNPISYSNKMNTTFLLTKYYENIRLCRRGEKQTQSKPNKAVTFQNGVSRVSTVEWPGFECRMVGY
jgi:hypothetical protein